MFYPWGRVKVPIGGYSPRAFKAGFGEIPKPTVTVWMRKDILYKNV